MKRRRSRHNPLPPPWYIPRQVEIPESYERAVQRDTEKLMREYARAQKRVAQAEARLGQVKAQKGAKRHLLAELQALVDLRRAELEEYRRQMESAPAGAAHRGTRSYRPVPARQNGLY